jgi:murein DD-endopeptidase MepM/ murein hydrolase activator NlpD
LCPQTRAPEAISVRFLGFVLVAVLGLGISGTPAVAVPAAPVVRAPVPAPVAGYRWPLDGVPAVVRPFDPPPRPWLPGHRGVDLAAAPGATVRAAGPGTVAFAGSVAGRGVVSVQHGNGLRTTYEPVEASVAAGTTVAAGAPIGVLVAGHAGCPAPACLHWGLRRGETYLDPLMLLGFGRVRLLPLDGAQEPG